MATLLDIVNQAEGELGLSISSSVAGNARQQSIQMLRLANSAGRNILRAHEWGDLINLATITTVSGQTDYAVEDDYDRMVPDTSWDRVNQRFMSGPVTAQSDRWLRESRTAMAGITRVFRQIGKTYVRIYPTPSADGETLVYEYVSKNWAESSSGAGKEAFTADDDVVLLDFDLFVKNVKWLFRNANGLDAQIYYNDWRVTLDQCIAADIGGGTLNMGPPDMSGDDFDVAAGAQPNFILSEGGDFVEFD